VSVIHVNDSTRMKGLELSIPPKGDWRMIYVIRATNISGRGGGTFTAEARTKRAALISAKTLRDQGMLVTVTGPDGKPVNETEET
jgi:hypothetical protein